MRMVGGTLLSCEGAKLTADQAAWRGKVARVDASDAEGNRVTLDPPLPQDVDLVGRTIHFINALALDTSYDIRSVTAEGISTGDITIVRGLADPADLSAGHTYLVNPGDEYVVPVVARA